MHLNLCPFLPSSPQGFSLASQLEGESRVALLCFLNTQWAHYKSHPAAQPGSAEGHMFHSFLHSTNAVSRHLLCVSH